MAVRRDMWHGLLVHGVAVIRDIDRYSDGESKSDAVSYSKNKDRFAHAYSAAPVLPSTRATGY
jgi:hypothetical protein